MRPTTTITGNEKKFARSVFWFKTTEITKVQLSFLIWSKRDGSVAEMRKFSHYLWILAGVELGQSVRRFPSRRGRPSTVYLEHGPKQVGKIVLVSWQQRREGFGGSSNDWNKNPLRRFLPLDTRHAFASPLLDKYYPFKTIFLCCFGIGFFYIIRECDFKGRYRVGDIIYCFLKLKNSQVDRNFLRCFKHVLFFKLIKWRMIFYIECIEIYGFDINIVRTILK